MARKICYELLNIEKKNDQKNFKLEAIENPKLTQNYTLQDTFKPLKKTSKTTELFFNIAKIKSNIYKSLSLSKNHRNKI